MHLMCSRGPAATVDHPFVQPLQVLGLQAVQPMLPDPGHQVLLDRDPVSREARVPQARAGDRLQPNG
jgi:hypothetical protein